MIWLGLGALLVVFFGLFLIKGRETDTLADPIALYKKQLADLEQDAANGILDTESAVAARLEIERRILRVVEPIVGQGPAVETPYMPLVLAVGASLAAVALYYNVGQPNLPAAKAQLNSLQDTPVEEGGPSFREAIERVEAHLEANPNDKQGWEVLAKSSRSVASFSRAATAFGKLAEMEPDNSRWRAQQLDAYIAMASGQITPAAKLVLQMLLEQEPLHPAGHYYLGLARRQAGDEDGAKEVWTALADRSPADAPWMSVLNERLAELGVRPPKLSDEQISAVAEMSVEERDEFVKSMVARLQARLESAPNDVAGWMMLARSQLALEGKEAAIQSLRKGLSHISGERAKEMQAFLDNLLLKDDP